MKRSRPEYLPFLPIVHPCLWIDDCGAHACSQTRLGASGWASLNTQTCPNAALKSLAERLTAYSNVEAF